MLARCSKCKSTFVTEQFGRQKCPVCSAEVVIRDPNAPLEAEAVPPAADGASPPPVPPAPARGPVAGVDDAGRTPWDRRAELGTFEALKQTLSGLVYDPAAFFERLAPGGDHLVGTLVWFFLTAAIPTAVATAVSISTTDFAKEYEESAEVYKQFGLPFDSDGTLRSWFNLLDRPEAAPAALLLDLFAMPLLLYVLAGVTQLALFMTGGSKRPFHATFRGVAYSFTPSLLMVVPYCGGLVGFVWTVVLQYLAVHKIHDAGAGRTVIAGFVLPFLLLVCGASLLGIAIGTLVGLGALAGG